jgi:hypothetical protein
LGEQVRTRGEAADEFADAVGCGRFTVVANLDLDAAVARSVRRVADDAADVGSARPVAPDGRL